MYVLNLDEDMRILSAWDKLPLADYGDRPIVDVLPDGNLYEYRYENGEYIHDPLPAPEEEEKPLTQEERIKTLENQNETLLQCILEMSELVYA